MVLKDPGTSHIYYYVELPNVDNCAAVTDKPTIGHVKAFRCSVVELIAVTIWCVLVMNRALDGAEVNRSPT